MAIDTANALVDAIRDLGLFAPARLDELLQLADQVTGPRDLARHTIQRGWLTAYQVNQLLQGRGKELVVGPYVLLERLGAGGMSEVFKARHRRLQRIAAIKVICRQRLGASGVQRFQREVEAVAQLAHPNIVAVYDAGAEGDRHYLAMEFIDGLDLARLVAQTGALPIPLACDFVRQTALGLASAHDKGFVHRDIKPSNLLVAPRGGMGKPAEPLPLERLSGATVKILDMGLVCLQPHRRNEPGGDLTEHGVVIGTLDYLAPEQARNAKRVDHRADLYGLGCTLYHLLAGQPPFPGGMALDKLLRHQTDEPTPLSEVRPEVPAEVVAVVGLLMAKRPEDRFQTAAEAATALASLGGKAIPTRVVQVPPLPVPRLPGRSGVLPLSTANGLDETVEFPPTPTPPPPQQRPASTLGWWLVGTALALALVAVGYALWR